MSIKTRTSGIMVNINVEPAVAAFATWNPSDKFASFTISPDNLTVTAPAGGFQTGSIRGTTSTSSGKRYFEHVVSTSPHIDSNPVGVANAALDLSFKTGDAASGKSVGWDGSGNVVATGSGTPIATIQTFAQGDTLGIAIDFDNMRAWFRTNGGNWNNSPTANPATNTEGIDLTPMAGGAPYFPAASLLIFADGPEVMTSNFGATAYANAAPAGFSNW